MINGEVHAADLFAWHVYLEVFHLKDGLSALYLSLAVGIKLHAPHHQLTSSRTFVSFFLRGNDAVPARQCCGRLIISLSLWVITAPQFLLRRFRIALIDEQPQIHPGLPGSSKTRMRKFSYQARGRSRKPCSLQVALQLGQLIDPHVKASYSPWHPAHSLVV